MWDLWLGWVWGMKHPWGWGSGPQLTQDLQVGWTPVNLVRKLLEKGNRVTLVLKKIPLDLPSSPPSPRQQVSDPSAPNPALSCAGNQAEMLRALGISHHTGDPQSSGVRGGMGLALTLHPQPPGTFSDAANSPGTRSSESPGSPVSLSSR